MTETLEPAANDVDQKQLAEQLLTQAKEQGVDLMGPNGLLNQLTKQVLEAALDAEMTEHLGMTNTTPLDVVAGIGPVEIEVARDTSSSFDPQIVRKRQRRLTGVDEIVLSLSAKGLTTGEIAAHFDDVYGATVSRNTISRITDKVLGRDGRVGQSASRSRLPGAVHRRSACEGPGRAGHQPAGLQRDRRHRRR